MVARGTTVLAKYATCAGNFIEVVEQVIAKIPPGNNKLTYSHGRYKSPTNVNLLKFLFDQTCILLVKAIDKCNVIFYFSYLFHYINEDRIIYLCITDDVSIADHY